MSEKRVFEGVVVWQDGLGEADTASIMKEGSAPGFGTTWDTDWLEGFAGKRVRLTVEVLDEATKEKSEVGQ